MMWGFRLAFGLTFARVIRAAEQICDGGFADLQLQFDDWLGNQNAAAIDWDANAYSDGYVSAGGDRYNFIRGSFCDSPIPYTDSFVHVASDCFGAAAALRRFRTKNAKRKETRLSRVNWSYL